MKWLFRLIGIVVVLALVAVGSLLLLPGERLARIASDQLSAQLGRKVEITGDVSFSFYPVLGVSTGPVTVANADWAGETPMLRAASAHIGLEALPLLRREVRVKALYADAPDVLLQRDAQGRVNWDFSDGNEPAPQSGSAGLPPVSIEDLRITNGAITYADAGSAPVAYRNVDLSLAWPDQAGPADVALTLRPAGEDVSVTARLPRPMDLLAGNGAQPVTAEISTDGGTASFVGNVSLVPEAQGKLTAELGSTARVLAALGMGGAEIPQGLGQSITLDTSLTFDAARKATFDGMSLALDQNRLTGSASVDLGGDKPRIGARLEAGALDLSALMAEDGESSGGATEWSTDPIDASALGVADGEIVLNADSVDLGDLQFAKTRVVVTIDRSRAVITIRELTGYQGGFDGEFVMNNRNGLSVGGKMRGLKVEAQELLADLMGLERLSGKADSEIQFLGVGQSVAQIVDSLEGTGNFTFGRGVISGIDLDKLMRSGDGSGGTTIFDSLTATYTMKNGVLRNEDLRLELPLIKAVGEGKVDLGKRTIDYTFTPRVLENENRKGYAIPVRIQGAWSNPRITADLEKAIELNLADEKKAVEEEVRKRVGDELGVEVDEDDSVEDVIKKKVEDEILKGIGDLLGGN
ncbi:AsmA family protein [Primorskyibacter aestuariivivens]|uniref:AsmA family protein n=1 Tax=Primorskyibacter aestuariivivens TaxID=1888912 RepID=UPI0023018C31|nr:AsmA family protein [Primorskyibacter aestuariivivens]MDA7428188.1 AsmA family protein [Primorskyibacter aestuariivivens]